jgi:DNA-binding winged helix-turn-helix (wHTH) protein
LRRTSENQRGDAVLMSNFVVGMEAFANVREIAFGRFRVRPAERKLIVDGCAVRLGGRAFDLLLALIERRDRTASKNELLVVVWPPGRRGK